jgi:hypothetical protein
MVMRRRLMAGLLGIVPAVALAIATPALAQTGGRRPALAVAGGVSFLDVPEATAAGVAIDVSRDLWTFGRITLGVAGDFGANWPPFFRITSYLAGVRIGLEGSRRYLPFGQFLLGVERCCETSAASFQVGAGLDVLLRGNLGARVQVEYRAADYEGESFAEARIVVGASYRLRGF